MHFSDLNIFPFALCDPQVIITFYRRLRPLSFVSTIIDLSHVILSRMDKGYP